MKTKRKLERCIKCHEEEDILLLHAWYGKLIPICLLCKDKAHKKSWIRKQPLGKILIQ